MDNFNQGILEFNSGKFFEAHETWEKLWKNAGNEKKFLQGLIFIAGGYYHYTKGNIKGAISFLEKGIGYLKSYEENKYGINVKAFIKDVSETIDKIKVKEAFSYPKIWECQSI